MKVGNTIYHKLLGNGKILEETEDYFKVLWNDTPPFDFNAGVNPCLILKSSIGVAKESYGDALKKLKEQAKSMQDEDDDDDIEEAMGRLGIPFYSRLKGEIS